MPYSQMKTMHPPLKVERGQGPYLVLEDGTKLLDAISSWWAVIHGYNNATLNRALHTQLSKIAHVMLGGITHKPAELLAEKLKTITGLNHVFFSDSGSVGCEVAIKMVIQYWFNKGEKQKNKLLCLKKGYHGDTIGAMSIGDTDDGMHRVFKPILMKNLFLPAPQTLSLSIEDDIERLEKMLKKNHYAIAAFILEPLVQCAGGFNMYDPLYLKEARKLCSAYNVLLIADEVATGFGRTGTYFACNQADITPDIMVLGKGLTGGYMGLAATITTSKVFQAFYTDKSEDCFMHGPTFMGNPLACAVALESIKQFETTHCLDTIQRIQSTFEEIKLLITHKKFKNPRALGAIFAVTCDDKNEQSLFMQHAQTKGVFVRPFDDVIYMMPPYILNGDELNLLKECWQ